MLAARLHAAKDVRLEDLPAPSPGPGEVLVRPRAVAICPSDWRLWDSGDAGGAPLTAPIIQGHEFAGDVVEVGKASLAGPRALDDAHTPRLTRGMRVAVEPSWHCGQCDQCAKGRYNTCRNVRFPSFPPVNGALAELVACPAVNCLPIPDSMSYAQGALLEPLGVAIHALRLAAVAPGERVALLGAGIIGLLSLQLLRREGPRQVGVVEPVSGRRERARAAGASPVVASHAELVACGYEADVVFECSGFSGALNQAMDLAAPGGRVIVVGIPHPELVAFEANVPRRKELSLVFTRRSRDTLAEAVELAASDVVDLSTVPVRRFRLEEAAAALALTGERPAEVLRAVVELPPAGR